MPFLLFNTPGGPIAASRERKQAGAGNFYDRVYAPERPELFLKATPLRVACPGGTMRLRRDSKWIVPEAELTLVINARNEIIGYTISALPSNRSARWSTPCPNASDDIRRAFLADPVHQYQSSA